MGGRGSSNPAGGVPNSFRNMPFSEQVKVVRGMQKQLTSAKAQETKTQKAYQSAEGAVLMSQTDEVRERYTAQADKAFAKYNDARNKREQIEKQLDKYTRAMRRRR